VKRSGPLASGDQEHTAPWEQKMAQEHAPFDDVNESVMTRTMEGIINFWNRSAEELYGWGKEEAVGRISHDLLQTQFPKPLKEIESNSLKRDGGKASSSMRPGMAAA
jgi:PAS domain S-box-containing protein